MQPNLSHLIGHVGEGEPTHSTWCARRQRLGARAGWPGLPFLIGSLGLPIVRLCIYIYTTGLFSIPGVEYYSTPTVESRPSSGGMKITVNA